MHRNALRGTALVVLAALLAACGGIERIRHKEMAYQLNETLKVYVQAVRWRNADALRALLRPRAPDAPPVDLAPLDNLRVTAAEFRLGNVSPETGEAVVDTTFEYHFGDSVRIRKLTQRSVWWYEADGRRWSLDGGLPAFER